MGVAGTQEGIITKASIAARVRVFQHEAYSLDAEDIGDFMRVRDDRRHPAGDDSPGVFPGPHQGAFQVDVGVYKAGADVTTLEIDRLPPPICTPDADDQRTGDGDFGQIDSSGKDVDEAGVRQHQIGRLVPAGNGDKLRQGHWMAHGCLILPPVIGVFVS